MEQLEGKEEVQESKEEGLSFKEELAEKMGLGSTERKEEAAPEPEREQKEVRPEPTQKTERREAAKPPAQDNTPPPVLTPNDMDAKEREIFEKADPVMKAYISRRSYETRAALSRESAKIHERGKHYDEIDKVIEPNKDYLDRIQTKPADALRRAIAWDKHIQENGAQGARDWLKAQGIDPLELLDLEDGQQQQGQPQQHQQLDPGALKAEIMAELQREQVKERQAADLHQDYNVVQQFMASKILFKDPNTAAALDRDMGPIVESLRVANPQASTQEVLEQAYNYVTKGNETYARLLGSYEQYQKANQAKAKADVARKASSSISGGIGGPTPVKAGLGFREELRLRMSGAI